MLKKRIFENRLKKKMYIWSELSAFQYQRTEKSEQIINHLNITTFPEMMLLSFYLSKVR